MVYKSILTVPRVSGDFPLNTVHSWQSHSTVLPKKKHIFPAYFHILFLCFWRFWSTVWFIFCLKLYRSANICFLFTHWVTTVKLLKVGLALVIWRSVSSSSTLQYFTRQTAAWYRRRKKSIDHMTLCTVSYQYHVINIKRSWK